MKRAAAAFLIASVALVAAPFTAFAALIYSQTDDTGSMAINASFNRIVGGDIGALNMTTGALYVTVTIQAPNATTGSQLYFVDSSGECQDYSFTSSDVATLSDGLFHTFTWLTTANLNPGVACTGSSQVHPEFYSMGTGAHTKADSTNTLFYLPYVGDTTPPPSDTSTRIEPTSPATKDENSTTTPSTTIDFSANYFYNSTSTPYGSYDSMVMYLNRIDAASSSITDFPGIQNDTYSSTSTTKTLPANSYWNLQWCFSQSAGTGLYACTPTQDIYVESNPLPNLFGTSTDNLTGLATSTCSITNVTGCVQNAVAFLFYPNSAVFDRFKTLQVNVQTHAPFGYVYTLIHQINNTSGAATPDFTLDIATSTQADLFTPIKNGIAAILWALAAFWFLKRIRDLHL